MTCDKTILEMIREDLQKREDKGVATYGCKLVAHNGRDALIDAYEEALDLCMYLRQVIAERDASKPHYVPILGCKCNDCSAKKFISSEGC